MFRRPNVRYGSTPEPVTPYQRAQQTWDDRSALRASRQRTGDLPASPRWRSAPAWRVAGMAGGPRHRDSMGRAGGQARQCPSLRPGRSNYHPTDAVIARDLANVIVWLRGVSVDQIDMRANWLRAYKFFTAKGQLFLNDYAQHNDPFARVGKEQVSVDVTSVVRASDQSFRIEWVERHYVDGALASTERWNAIVTVTISPPRTADGDTLNINPLGIYIDALNWSKELN